MINDDASLYQRIKQSCYSALEDPHHPFRHLIKVFMIVLVLVSVWVMIAAVDPDLSSEEQRLMRQLDDFFVWLFFLEYLLHLWICSNVRQDFLHARQRWKRRSNQIDPVREFMYAAKEAALVKVRWALQPFAMVDLLAALPLFWGFRVLRVIRLMKLFRYSKRLSIFNGVIRDRAYELKALFALAFVLWGMIMVAFFVVERVDNDNISAFWDAIYWTIITITTVGYGDILPVTPMGKAIAVLGTLSGMWVTMFMTSIIVSGLTERIVGLKELQMISQIDRMQKHHIVCGLDTLGQAVCRALQDEEHAFVGVDMDDALVENARKEGWVALQGNVTESETWDRLGLKQARSVISSFEDEANNVYVVLLVTEHNPDCFIVVTGESPRSVERLKKLGAHRVVSPFLLGGTQLANYAVRPHAIRLIDLALQKKHVELELEEIKVPEGSRLDTLSLVDSQVRTEFNIIIVAIVRQNQEMVFNPTARAIIHGGDNLICLGHLDDLERLKHSLDYV